MKPLGLVDGKIFDLHEKVIQLEDRGYQFGDGVYEVTSVYNGRCFCLKLHLDRLYQSLQLLKIPATYTVDKLTAFHEQLINKSGIKKGVIYLQITRGAAPRSHVFPDNATPRLTMSIRPMAAYDQLRNFGVRGILVPDLRWLRCDIKSINLLGNVLAKQQAIEADAFEAIQVRDGIVTEGAVSNFFVVSDGVLWTHPLSNLILRGITRTVVIDELIPQLGLTVVEKQFDVAFAKKADEAFITATGYEIMPITALDGTNIGTGKIGPVTSRLLKAHTTFIAKECGIV